MYTPFATRRLVRLDEARARRAAQGIVPLWRENGWVKAMSEASEDRLELLRDQSRRGLQFLVSSMLTNSEGALLAMAGKARSNAEQTQYYDAIRELRLKGRPLEERFMGKVLAGFEALRAPAPAQPAPARAATVPQSAETRLDGLGVLQETLLEQQIAIDNIASRAKHQHRDVLLAIARHIASELGQRRVDIDALPTGPQGLSRAFMDACAESEIDQRSRLMLSRLFTRFVIDELGPFYEQCLRVFPAPEAVAAAKQEDAVLTGSAASRAGAAEALPTLHSEEDDPARGGAAAMEQGWDIGRTPLLAPPGKAMAMPRSLVDEMLLDLQEDSLEPGRVLAVSNPRAGVQPLEVFELVNAALERAGHTRAMALPGEVVETIGLVRLLFEHALRDPQVPLPVRRLSRLLQLPLLRAALRDADVLSSAEHPIRLFFRELSEAAVGWSPSGDPSEDDFFRLVQLLVTRIVNDYDKDAAVFVSCLEDLRRYVRGREGAVRLEEQRSLAATTGKAEAQAARAAVADLLTGAVGPAAVPRALHEFLRGQWSDALFVIRLRDGVQSAEWGLAVETTGRLVAASAPGTPDEVLDAALQGVSVALRRLGLDEAAARDRALALRAAMHPDAPRAAGAAAPGRPAQPSRPPASPEFVQLVDRMAPDTWIELRERGVERRRAKLLTRIPKTGVFVFVDRDGGKAGEWTRADLAAMIENGEAVILHAASAGGTPGRPGRR